MCTWCSRQGRFHLVASFSGTVEWLGTNSSPVTITEHYLECIRELGIFQEQWFKLELWEFGAVIGTVTSYVLCVTTTQLYVQSTRNPLKTRVWQGSFVCCVCLAPYWRLPWWHGTYQALKLHLRIHCLEKELICYFLSTQRPLHLHFLFLCPS